MDRTRLLLAVMLGTACTSDPSTDCGDRCDEGDGTLDPGGTGPQYARFADAPATACVAPAAGQKAAGDFIDDKGRSCIPGVLPPTGSLSESERRGLAAWLLFSGDGKALRQVTIDTAGKSTTLRVLDTTEVPRGDRFQKFGVLNDPGCKPGSEPDEFGFVFDRCEDPYSTGIVGLRLKPNPKFDPAAWDALGKAAGGTGAKGHFAAPDKTFKLSVNGATVEKHGWEVEPPYLPSLACAFCHSQPSPTRPPADVANPQWNEIGFALGNQYFNPGALLGQFWPEGEFPHEALLSQAPGTADTAGAATDNILNPNVINGLANLAARRIYIEDFPLTNSLGQPQFNPDRIPCQLRDDPAFPRTVGGLVDAIAGAADPRSPTGECVPTSRVLINGADSSGPTGALLRVYVNVGSCTDQLLEAAGGRFLVPGAQRPISRARLHGECSEYQDMEPRVVDTLRYLMVNGPQRLADAPGGAAFLDPGQAERGKIVFAENCATCHSSIQPDDPGHDERDPNTWFTPARQQFFRDLVQRDDFLATNYLSDDRRYPIDLLGTNAARAYGDNAASGKVWEEFSSQTYRQLPPVAGAELEIPLPFGLDFDFTLDTADGGRGYYRTPSLVNLWSSAPFLHTNGLGHYTGDPSVQGRMDAFADAAEKLLLLRERDGKATIRRTTRKTTLMGVIPILSGWPIDTFANLGLLFARNGADTSFLDKLNPLNVKDRIKTHLGATDPVQDKGHLFGAGLPESDRRALIEYLKMM